VLPPVYLILHSSDTGECPAGQSKCIPTLFCANINDDINRIPYLHCLQTH
jgi:hypothetical protein